MCQKISTIQKSDIVAGDNRQTQFGGQLQGVTFIPLFLLTPRALNFNIKAVWKILHPALGILSCLVGVSIDQGLAYIALTPAG